MKKEYKYSNLKQETNTSGKVMLEPSKKTKKRKPGVKPRPKTLRQLMLEGFSKINKRLDNVEKRLDNVEKRLDKVDKRLDNVEDVLQRNNLK